MALCARRPAPLAAPSAPRRAWLRPPARAAPRLQPPLLRACSAAPAASPRARQRAARAAAPSVAAEAAPGQALAARAGAGRAGAPLVGACAAAVGGRGRRRRPAAGGARAAAGAAVEAAAGAAAGSAAGAAAGAAAGGRAGGHRPVLPGLVSPRREVPASVRRPAYMHPGARNLQGPLGQTFERQPPWHPFQHSIEVKAPAQIDAMRAAGALAREALAVAGHVVAPGVTTDALDAAVHAFVIGRGAYPSPLGYMGFPKSVSTSVNDVLAHGIPDDRPLEDGDILNVDVTVFAHGHHGDTSAMFTVGAPDPEALRLCRAARDATAAGIAACRPGADFREVGSRIQAVADAAGYYVDRNFVGHGIGSYFHGMPEVIPHVNDVDQGLMLPGMTFTVEPILVEGGDGRSSRWGDGWTLQSPAGARSAQFEHTLLITEEGCDVLTAPTVDFDDPAAVAAAGAAAVGAGPAAGFAAE